MAREREMDGHLHDLSTAQLVERMSTQVSELVRDEMQLATAELKRKGTRAGLGVGLSGIAGLIALFGLAGLVAAAIIGIGTALAYWLAALIIGGGLLLIAGVLALAGLGQVRRSTPAKPEEAVQSTKRDVAMVKEHVRR